MFHILILGEAIYIINQGTDAEITVAQRKHQRCPAIGVIFAGGFFWGKQKGTI